MAYPAIYAPAIGLAHLIALVLGLYSLEKSLGLLSKAAQRLGLRWPRPSAEDDLVADLVHQPAVRKRSFKRQSSVAAGKGSVADEGACSPSRTGLQSRQSTDWDSSREARSLTRLTSVVASHKRAPRWRRAPDKEVSATMYLASYRPASLARGRYLWPTKMLLVLT